MTLPPTTKDFTVLPIIYKSPPPLKNKQHILYLKEHISKPPKFKTGQDLGNETRETYPNGRTLFVVNTPPDSTERELRLFFQSCGHVERVILQQGGEDGLMALAEEDGDDEDEDEDENENEDNGQDQQIIRASNRKRRKREKEKPPQVIPLPLRSSEIPLRIYRPTGSAAYIVFADPGALSMAFQLRDGPENRRIWPFGAESSSEIAVAPSGLAHYVALHAAERPPLDMVKKHADSYIEVYEYNKAMSTRKSKSKYKKGEAIVDEDGFTLVVRGGAYGQSIGGGVGVASKLFIKELEDDSTSKPKKKKKKHEKEDFYKFQIHEKRRQDLIELKANFEKDKEKIISAKRSRYKPY
ncbi:hypothetical protein Clacol_006785 [Clathrus columnatus]|uniref:Ribosomal RNA-processing protein 7 n=1 Tax=Clathrus columnatus TaxID=1419009 RepID=A0AAV5AD22_9AGAM|nr:hypothetical protein Clacol_006785 [Clathrus columnatus]